MEYTGHLGSSCELLHWPSIKEAKSGGCMQKRGKGG